MKVQNFEFEKDLQIEMINNTIRLLICDLTSSEYSTRENPLDIEIAGIKETFYYIFYLKNPYNIKVYIEISDLIDYEDLMIENISKYFASFLD